jgi:hypothetical protein
MPHFLGLMVSEWGPFTSQQLIEMARRQQGRPTEFRRTGRQACGSTNQLPAECQYERAAEQERNTGGLRDLADHHIVEADVRK